MIFISVGSGACIGGGGKANATIRNVENRVETLEECIPVDKVEAFSTGGAQVSDNQVDIVRCTADGSVECTRPELSIGSELISNLESKPLLNHRRYGRENQTDAVNYEEQTLQVRKLGGGDAQKTGGIVWDSTSGTSIPGEGV